MKNPKIHIDKKQTHISNAQLKLREEQMPICNSKNFIPPKELSAKELKIWDWLVSIIRETPNSPVCDADVFLMQMYCQFKVSFDEVEKMFRENPEPYILVDTGMKDSDGQPKMVSKPNLYKKWLKDDMKMCIDLLAQLGFSPLARAKFGLNSAVAKEKAEKEDAMAIFQKIMNRSDD